MAHPRKFRFGVQATAGTSAAEWRDFARKVEDLGYSTLFMPDHFIDTTFAPMTAICFAAAHTETLRVGHLVLGNDYKHPAIVAKEAATIDVLSDGRLEFGLGAGWMRTDYDALGLPYDSPGTRIERLAEALAVIKGAWGDGPVDFAGNHYTITDYHGIPKPVQSPRPPILVGGGGPRLLRLAGREADIVGINPNLRAGEIGPDAVKDALAEVTAKKIGWVREGAGERFDDLELQIRYFMSAVTDDPKGLADALAPGFGISSDDALASGVALVGTVDGCIETLQQRRETWGVSYVVLGQDNFEAFAPVVAALAGT
ncbi:MAG: TIGR03621 family F420-dependent LLM class oxidoreductase [Acidimicrobiia bacterium]